jgi:hypothetical protein
MAIAGGAIGGREIDARQTSDRLPRASGDAKEFRELEPTEVWITHSREGPSARKHWCTTHQIKACELNLVSYKDEDD